MFISKVGKKLLFEYNDPAKAIGTEEDFLEFKKTIDQIKNDFYNFYKNELIRE